MSRQSTKTKSAWLIMWKGLTDGDSAIYRRPRIVAILDYHLSENTVGRYLQLLYYSDQNLSPSWKNGEMHFQSVRHPKDSRWKRVEKSAGVLIFGSISPWLEAKLVSGLYIEVHDDNSESTYWVEKSMDGQSHNYKLPFTKYRLPGGYTMAVGFLAAMAIPSLCIAPLAIWRSYANLEQRLEDKTDRKQARNEQLENETVRESAGIPEMQKDSMTTPVVNADLNRLREKAQSGDALAQALLGYALCHGTINGNEIKIEEAEAISWIEKSAEADHPLGLCLRGFMRKGPPLWMSGFVKIDEDGAKRDRDKALKNGLYRNAENGGPVWWSVLGHLLSRPDVIVGCKEPEVIADRIESMKWYRRAAEQGEATAECAIGWAYYMGSRVPLDWNEVSKWLRKAALHGDVNAAYVLGSLYSGGEEGVPKSEEEAMKWYRKAAEQGHGLAARFLFRFYTYGDRKDLREAIKWCGKAVDKGFESNNSLASLVRDKEREDKERRELCGRLGCSKRPRDRLYVV